MLYAIVTNGVVTDFVSPPDGRTLAQVLSLEAGQRAAAVAVPAGMPVAKGWACAGGAFSAPAAPAPTAASATAALRSLLQQRELAGINFTPTSGPASGIATLFPTDPTSQIKYAAAWNALNANPPLAADGDTYLSAAGAPVALTISDAKAMIAKALTYLRACQANYAALYVAMQGNPAISLTTGWPSK